MSINEDLRSDIEAECDAIKERLLEKWHQPMMSLPPAPIGIFSKASRLEVFAIRLDERLGRIARTGIVGADEAAVLDLISHLVCFRLLEKLEANKESPDSPLSRALGDVKDELARAEQSLGQPRSFKVSADGERVPRAPIVPRTMPDAAGLGKSNDAPR